MEIFNALFIVILVKEIPELIVHSIKLISLLLPLQIWLALIGALYFQIALFFTLNHMFFPANEKAFLKHNHQLDFKAYKKKKNTKNFRKMKSIFSTFYKPAQYWIDKIFIQNKKILYLSNRILRFQHRCHKKVIELHVVQFLYEIKLVISNQTCTVHLFEFEITKMMSDWIAPLSSMTIMNPTEFLIKDTNKKQFWLILCANSDQIVFIPSPSFPLP